MTEAPVPSQRRSSGSAEPAAASASDEIDRLVAGLTDWRGETLAAVRAAIRGADPDIFETWKWMGSPVWECCGILAVGNAHKEKVKLTFQDGARLADAHGLFNAGLGGGKWRAIDFHEGDPVRAPELQALVREAVAFNRAKRGAKPAGRAKSGAGS